MHAHDDDGVDDDAQWNGNTNLECSSTGKGRRNVAATAVVSTPSTSVYAEVTESRLSLAAMKTTAHQRLNVCSPAAVMLLQGQHTASYNSIAAQVSTSLLHFIIAIAFLLV